MTKKNVIPTLFLCFLVLCAERTPAPAETGIASFYHEGQYVACGVKNGKSKRYDPMAMTAAHKSLPCGTKVKVTRKDNGNSVVVTINDRGPYINGRVIDLSVRAAQELGMIHRGVVPITLARL